MRAMSRNRTQPVLRLELPGLSARGRMPSAHRGLNAGAAQPDCPTLPAGSGQVAEVGGRCLAGEVLDTFIQIRDRRLTAVRGGGQFAAHVAESLAEGVDTLRLR